MIKIDLKFYEYLNNLAFYLKNMKKHKRNERKERKKKHFRYFIEILISIKRE